MTIDAHPVAGPQELPAPAAAPARPLAVYKLGGSLLDQPRLPALLRQLWEQRPAALPALVTGGGAAADLVRQWDAIHALGNASAHQLALAAMALNERLVRCLVPELRAVRSGPQLALARAAPGAGNRPVLLCASCCVGWAERAGHAPLAREWATTSDSIAAWLASALGAAELILLKSTDLPADATLDQAARAGLVDERFPGLARQLPMVGWVNLRADLPRLRTFAVAAQPGSS